MVKKRDHEFLENKVIVLYDNIFPLYIVKGEKNFLIDSGIAVRAPDVYERINHVLKEANPEGNDKIDTLLLTHSHWDHTGAAFYLQQKYGFDVIASQRTVELLQKRKVVDIINRMNRGYKELVKSDSDIRFDYLQKLQAVKEGDTIRLDSGSFFEVFETPGHTKCSIAFLLQPEKILFPGDAVGLIDDKGGIRPLFFSNYACYEKSLKKLARLDAAALAFPHNKFIKGKERVKKHLNDALIQALGVKNLILKYLKTEQDTAKITEAIYKHEFSNTTFIGSRETLMENIEVMVKIIARESRAAASPTGGQTDKNIV
jgi:glyoxylase-like metal-dependent hydrolase (beta-lactamase superfamily II)